MVSEMEAYIGQSFEQIKSLIGDVPDRFVHIEMLREHVKRLICESSIESIVRLVSEYGN